MLSLPGYYRYYALCVPEKTRFAFLLFLSRLRRIGHNKTARTGEGHFSPFASFVTRQRSGGLYTTPSPGGQGHNRYNGECSSSARPLPARTCTTPHTSSLALEHFI
mgnify:CR=1 FL=1